MPVIRAHLRSLIPSTSLRRCMRCPRAAAAAGATYPAGAVAADGRRVGEGDATGHGPRTWREHGLIRRVGCRFRRASRGPLGSRALTPPTGAGQDRGKPATGVHDGQ
jgi:hypothetical protein